MASTARVNAWNRPPDAVLEAGRARAGYKGVLTSSAALLLVASAFWFLARESPVALCSSRTLVVLQPFCGWGGYVAAVCFGLLGGVSLTALPATGRPSKWAATLDNKRRQLYGLPPAATPARAAPAPRAVQDPSNVRQKPTTPTLGPPLRHVKPMASPGTPSTPVGTPAHRDYSHLGRATLTSSPTPGSGGRGGARVVSTPEQLQRYMDAFDESATTTESPEPAYTGYGSYMPGSAGAGGALNAPPNPALPVGANAPKYRPSLQPRGKAGSPHRADGQFRPSSRETVDQVLEMLKTDWRTLEVWTDNLREWLASEVLKPLLRLMTRAHKDVMDSTTKLGWTISLSSLADTTDGGHPSRTATATSEADDEVLTGQLREQLLSRLPPRAQVNPQDPSVALAQQCLQGVNRYQHVHALLKGHHPRYLLHPIPERGYIAARIRALAQGTSLHEFTWNGGGDWNAKRWNAQEYPTDGALVLYIFAAFLEAPRWDFALEDHHPQVSLGGPLFIGALPPRPPEFHYAILSSKPPLQRGAVMVIVMGLGTAEPNFTLVLQGEPAATLGHNHGLFHALLLFLQCAKLHGAGVIGGRTLDYLKLTSVLKPAEPSHNLFAGKWWGLW